MKALGVDRENRDNYRDRFESGGLAILPLAQPVSCLFYPTSRGRAFDVLSATDDGSELCSLWRKRGRDLEAEKPWLGFTGIEKRETQRENSARLNVFFFDHLELGEIFFAFEFLSRLILTYILAQKSTRATCEPSVALWNANCRY